MASSTDARALALALVALFASGCMTGHLLDAGRRREEVVAYHDAFIVDDRLVLGYRARVSDDHGAPLGMRELWAAVALAVLRAPRVPPVDAFPVAWLEGPPAAGARARLEIDRADGRDTSFVLDDGAGTAYARFYSGALTRIHTAPWVYPLLPLAVVADAATNPVLLLFAPAVICVGE